jgi:hypothetical protein
VVLGEKNRSDPGFLKHDEDRIRCALTRVFPQARALELRYLDAGSGEFSAWLRLPTRKGEAEVAIHRFTPGPPPEQRRLELQHRLGTGHGEWHWSIEYDDGASEEEVIQLVAKQLLRDPQLGDLGADRRNR